MKSGQQKGSTSTWSGSGNGRNNVRISAKTRNTMVGRLDYEHSTRGENLHHNPDLTVLDDARNIFDTLRQADYIQYWNDECEALKQKITVLPPDTTSKLREEIKKSIVSERRLLIAEAPRLKGLRYFMHVL